MISKNDTTYLIERFFESCFKFWINEGKSDREAFELALKETSGVDRDPFTPMGDLFDSDAVQEYIIKKKKELEE